MLHNWLNLQWLVDALFGDAWLSLGLSDVSDASLSLLFGAEPEHRGAGD
jgi:hypothetical protein